VVTGVSYSAELRKINGHDFSLEHLSRWRHHTYACVTHPPHVYIHILVDKMGRLINTGDCRTLNTIIASHHSLIATMTK